MASIGHIDKPQRGRPKRAELPDVNKNAQSINTESFLTGQAPLLLCKNPQDLCDLTRRIIFSLLCNFVYRRFVVSMKLSHTSRHN